MFQHVTPKGFIDAEGNEHECDVFVCATGFDTSFKPRFPVIAHGVNIQDRWKEYPNDCVRSARYRLSFFHAQRVRLTHHVLQYMSIAVKDVPNVSHLLALLSLLRA